MRKYPEGTSLYSGVSLAQTHLPDPRTSACLWEVPGYQLTIGAMESRSAGPCWDRVPPDAGPSQSALHVGWTHWHVGGSSVPGDWLGSLGDRAPVLFFSSPVRRGGVEPLERLCGPVQAGSARAAAPGAAGAPERRRALPGPGGESRLPGVLDAAGPGLRACLR